MMYFSWSSKCSKCSPKCKSKVRRLKLTLHNLVLFDFFLLPWNSFSTVLFLFPHCGWSLALVAHCTPSILIWSLPCHLLWPVRWLGSWQGKQTWNDACTFPLVPSHLLHWFETFSKLEDERHMEQCLLAPVKASSQLDHQPAVRWQPTVG